MPFPRGAVVLLAVPLLVLAGCGELAQRRLDFDQTEDVRVTKIEITPGSGDVVIRTAPVSDVQIKRVVRYHADEPEATYRIDGTVLTIDTDCGRRCSVSYDITAPEGVAVEGENGSGDLTLTEVSSVDVTVGSGSITATGASGTVHARAGSGDISVTDAGGAVALRAGSGSITVGSVAGALTVETGSGDIRVTDAGGSVALRTGSGSIEGRDLGGGDVTATAGSGAITLVLGAPQSVRAETGSGAINLTVPAGSYRVAATTRSGDKDLQVTSDPAAPLLLELRTGSGDIGIARAS